jgi:hypothetical protein
VFLVRCNYPVTIIDQLIYVKANILREVVHDKLLSSF